MCDTANTRKAQRENSSYFFSFLFFFSKSSYFQISSLLWMTRLVSGSIIPVWHWQVRLAPTPLHTHILRKDRANTPAPVPQEWTWQRSANDLFFLSDILDKAVFSSCSFSSPLPSPLPPPLPSFSLLLLPWGWDKHFKIYPCFQLTVQRVSVSEMHQPLFLKGPMLMFGSQLLDPRGRKLLKNLLWKGALLD